MVKPKQFNRYPVVLLPIMLLSVVIALPIAAQERQATNNIDDDANYVTATALLSGEALFRLDSRVLTERGVDALLKLINDLHEYSKIVAIKVTGHTDSSGPADYNLRLSAARARHIAGFFEQTFPKVTVTAEGMGETIPLVGNDTFEGRRRNRRVEVEVIAQAVRE